MGTPVAVVLVGFDTQMVQRTGIAKAFPDMPIIQAAGGHDHNGDARQKLETRNLFWLKLPRV